uniref:Uncharacterized protein n=1 Tax=Rhodosorus marinus TaxID=101924 RepID=A0A7S2ZT71_9RHOD
MALTSRDKVTTVDAKSETRELPEFPHPTLMTFESAGSVAAVMTRSRKPKKPYRRRQTKPLKERIDPGFAPGKSCYGEEQRRARTLPSIESSPTREEPTRGHQ